MRRKEGVTLIVVNQSVNANIERDTQSMVKIKTNYAILETVV